jgi:4-amino-4-deoxy-L-arabinose transferase-like glycosyltransferase
MPVHASVDSAGDRAATRRMIPPPAPATQDGRAAWERTPWVVVFAVALLARLAFVTMMPDVVPWSDARGYVEMGRTLLQQRTYGLQTLRGPGYPTFIAAVYAVFGPHLVGLRVVESVLGALAAVLIGVGGARLFGRPAGLIAAALAALHPVLAFLPSTQFAENLLLLTTVLGLGAIFEAARRGAAWRWAASGVMIGVILLVRPNSVLRLPGLGLGFAVLLHRERRPWLAPALICATAIALTLAPWIVRSHRVHDQWFFIATGGGRQFWFGNNPRATADTRVPSVLDSSIQAEVGPLPNDTARERYLYARGREFIGRHPGRAAWLYLCELRNLFALYPETETRNYINVWSRLAQGTASAVVFAGALLALARFRTTRAQWPLVGAVASFAAGSACFFTVMRYRVAIEPCLLWLAGSGWAAAIARRAQSLKR